MKSRVIWVTLPVMIVVAEYVVYGYNLPNPFCKPIANTIAIANRKIAMELSMPASFSIAAVAPANRSNKASIFKTFPGYLEWLTTQLLTATAATKKGKAKRFIHTDKCASVTRLKTNTTKFPVTCAEHKRLALTNVVVSAYPATKLSSPL